MEESVSLRIKEYNGVIYNEDIFETQTIQNLMKSCKGRILLMLDNGHKLKELQRYQKFLKMGDIVMLHDYRYMTIILCYHQRVQEVDRNGMEVRYPMSLYLT